MVATVLGAFEGTLFCVVPILGLLWLHGAWSRLPAPCRRAYDGRRIAPDEAVWKLFIPVYGVFWLFTVNVGLCGAVERHLARGGAPSTKAPSTLAFVACLAQLVPVVSVVVSPFLWGAFMYRMDAVQAEAERLDPGAPPPTTRGPWKVFAIIVAGTVLGWVVLIVTFLAVWQFLNPPQP
jgi:hypothetical protein